MDESSSTAQLARKPVHACPAAFWSCAVQPAADVAAVLQAGDILLVEGNTRISTAIKYLTQSSWSHACLYVGGGAEASEVANLLEADLNHGVRLVSVERYANFNLRICRPVDLSSEDTERLISFAKSKLGHRYDLKNVFDLIRYLIQKPAAVRAMAVIE